MQNVLAGRIEPTVESTSSDLYFIIDKVASLYIVTPCGGNFTLSNFGKDCDDIYFSLIKALEVSA
jgi:hypothetical protein